MIRTVITPQQQNISIDLPPEYIGRQIEVIAFALDEGETGLEDKTLTHFASEKVLAKDWLTPEEDSAWHNL